MTQLIQEWYFRSATDLVRYSEPLTPPPTNWTPASLVRNKPRIRAADSVDHVDWETYYVSGDTTTIGGVPCVDVQAVCNRVPPGPTGHTLRIMSMPAGQFVINDFTKGNYDGLRLANGGAVNVKGLHGSGWDNTILRPRANSASRDKYRRAPGDGLQPPVTVVSHTYAPRGIAGNFITISQATGASLTNLAVKGNPQNVTLDGTALNLGYNGVIFSRCPNSVCSIYGRGMNPGWANSPPGETFGVSFTNSDDSVMIDSEIDGRDDAGTRVSASPVAWNGSGGGGSATDGNPVLANQGVGATFVKNAQVIRCYLHHGVAGMLTWWITENIYTEDVWSFGTGSNGGGTSGHNFNHEMYRGTVTHVRPYCFIRNASAVGAPPPPLPNDALTTNAGMHFSITTTVPISQLGLFQVLEPVWDKAYSGTGMLLMRSPDLYSGYHNTANDGPEFVVTKSGRVLLERDHPASGWNTQDPAVYYSHVH